MKKYNSRLKAVFMEIVDNQIKANDPPETRRTLNRLVDEGISTKDAKIYIARAICLEVFDLVKHGKEFSKERYLRNLARLPDAPQE